MINRSAIPYGIASHARTLGNKRAIGSLLKKTSCDRLTDDLK
ncbi:MAG: hypothetical protein U7126_12890 [Microcoleus sp.]